jgi:hypothetical protein
MDNKALANFVRTEVAKITSAMAKVNQTFTSLIGEMREQNKKAIYPEHDTNRKDESPQQGVALVSPTPEDPTRAENSTSPARPRRSIRRKITRGAKRIFLKKDRMEKIGILFAMGYAVVNFLQWHDANRNFRIDQRCWEKIEVIRNAGSKIAIDWAAGKQITVPLRISNSGKTVALQNNLTVFVEVLSPSESPNLRHVGQQHAIGFHSFTGAFFPNEVQDFQVPRLNPDDGTSELTTDAEAADQTKYIAVYGIVEYDDVFGKHHWTKFCHPINLSSPYNAADCVNYNDVDKNN